MVYILLGTGFEEAEALVTADVLRRADIPVALVYVGDGGFMSVSRFDCGPMRGAEGVWTATDTFEYQLHKCAITGSHDIMVKTDLAVDQVTLTKGDMVVLPGGLRGVDSIETTPAAMELIRQAAEDPAIWLAAICAAPTLLARAGLLAPGVRAVCYPGMEDALTKAGAVPVMDQSVVADGRLVTGRGPGSAFDFGLALAEVLAGAEAADQVRAGLHYGA